MGGESGKESSVDANGSGNDQNISGESNRTGSMDGDGSESGENSLASYNSRIRV